MILDPVVGILILASVALLFASAAVHKLRDLARFDEIFSAYGMMPASSTLRTSRAVPLLEMAVAAGLASNVTRPYAVNLGRGRLDIRWGYRGVGEGRPIAGWMVWRNILIALAAATAFAPWTERGLTMTDGVTIAFGLLTVALIYLCADQLLGNAQRTAQLRGTR